MSDLDEGFEPIKFPIDKKTDVLVAKYGKLVNLFYDLEGDEINLTLKPKDAIKFADLLILVANEIIDEESE